MKKFPIYELTGNFYYIEKKKVYIAKLTTDCTRSDLKGLLNTRLGNSIITGVESFAIENQKQGMPIGLLVE